MINNLPPIPEQGDDSEDITYAAVGYALSQWEFTELELCWLYAVAANLVPGSRHALEQYSLAGNAARRIENLASKVYANVSISSDYAKTIAAQTLLDQARAGCEERNKVAHGTVVELRRRAPSRFTPMVHDAGTPEYCLVPAYYNHRRVDLRVLPTYIFIAADIRKIGAGFCDLYDKIVALRSALLHPIPSWPRKPS